MHAHLKIHQKNHHVHLTIYASQHSSYTTINQCYDINKYNNNKIELAKQMQIRRYLFMLIHQNNNTSLDKLNSLLTDHTIDSLCKMVAWVVELSEYDITYAPRNRIKSQVLVNFLRELSSPTWEKMLEQWILSMDESSNLKGSKARILLEGPGELILEQSLYFNF